MNIGPKVAALREAKQWTLAHVAKLTGISVSHLSAIENGTRQNPSFAMIAKIAQAYGVPLEYFTAHDTQDLHTDAARTVIDHGYDKATAAFLASEDGPRYVAFAKRLADCGALDDKAALLQWIATYLREEDTAYDPRPKQRPD